MNYVEARALDKTPGRSGGSKQDHYFITRSFIDGLGRGLMSKTEAEPAAGEIVPRVVVNGALLFNARRGVSTTLNPYFSTQVGEDLYSKLGFEDIEGAGWQGVFHELGELKSLGLDSAHKTDLRYDALLRSIGTINPDGTRAQTIYEPLMRHVFDENDIDPFSAHFNTPMGLSHGWSGSADPSR